MGQISGSIVGEAALDLQIVGLAGNGDKHVSGLRTHSPMINRLLRSEALGNSKIAGVQLRLPRTLRNLDQARKVDLIDGAL